MTTASHERFIGVRLARVLGAVILLGALAVVGLRAWASVATGSAGLSLPAATTGVVWDVRPGSVAWLNGVRAGDSYALLAGDGTVEVHTAGTTISLSTALPPLPLEPALVAAAILALAVVARFAVPTVGALVLVVSVLVAGDDLLGWLPMPPLVMVLLGPALAAALLAMDRIRAGSWVAMAALAIWLVASGATVALSFAAEPPFPEMWGASRLLPLGVVAILLLEAGATLGMEMREAHASGAPTYLPILRATAIGRRALRMTVEEERDRAAQRVHDQVLPGLALVMAGPATPPAARVRVASIADSVRTAIMDDQLLVLRHVGLEGALRDVIDRAGHGGSYASIVAEESEGRPPWDVEVAAYRIAQEAIDNARRHATAKCLEVRIEAHARRLRIDVEDDGVGIDDEFAHGRAGHLGIRAMETRARDVGGRLTVGRGAGGGTRVTFRWPA